MEHFAKLENWFVDSFISTPRAERAKLELRKPDGRKSFFSKPCHSYGQYIDARFLHPVKDFDWLAKRELKKTDRLFASDDSEWFVMAHEESIDRRFVKRDEARQIDIDQRMPVIFVSAHRYAYFQAEFEKRLPKFLLKVDNSKLPGN